MYRVISPPQVDIAKVIAQHNDDLDAIAELAASVQQKQQSGWRPENRGDSEVNTPREWVRRVIVKEARSGSIYLFNDVNTEPHRIYPKKANALAFKWGKIGGAQVFVPKKPGATYQKRDGTLIIGKGYVNHPGTTGKELTEAVIKEIESLAEQQCKRGLLSQLSR